MAAPLNTCTTIEQRGVVRFFVGKKYGSKGYPQRNAAHMGSSNRARLEETTYPTPHGDQRLHVQR
jgi:hypothetical protein